MISDRVGLVSLLYDKLLQRLQEARTAIDVNDVPTRASAISKAIELIEVGLLSSLDGARGGDIALRLRGHYQLWLAKLLEANLNASPVLLQEVDAEVRTIKSAWDELRSTTTVARNP
jgi:flagellar protein FliS